MANTPTPKRQTKKAPQITLKTPPQTPPQTATQTAPQTATDSPKRGTIDPQSAQTLKQSLGYIVATILLALAGYFGWTYWQTTGKGPDTVAADKYAVIEEKNQALQLSEDEATRQQLNADIDALVTAHGDTIFAWQALMIKANNAAYRQDYATAGDALAKATSIKLQDAGLMALAQLRYATVLLAKGEVDEAMTHASKDVPMSFEASQQELLGDIYMAKKDNDSAIRSYNNAWAMLVKREEPRPILRLKLESLGIHPAPVAPAPQVVSEAAIQTKIGNMDTNSTATANEADSDSQQDGNDDNDDNKDVTHDNNPPAQSLTTDSTVTDRSSQNHNETPAIQQPDTASKATTTDAGSENVADSQRNNSSP